MSTSRVLRAVYENGTLRPLEPLHPNLREHQRVTLTLVEDEVNLGEARRPPKPLYGEWSPQPTVGSADRLGEDFRATAQAEDLKSARPSEEVIGWSIDDEIEHLYDEIITLTHKEPASRGSKGRTETIEHAYARLLELQTAEAERHRQQFEASLNMPIDAGERILARMRALREELEDLAAPDPTSDDTDNP